MIRRAIQVLGWALGGMSLACGGSGPNGGTPTPTATPNATPATDTGRNYRVLHHLAAGANDVTEPGGALIQQGSTLYGMSVSGGRSNLGAIFQIGADGTGFGLLHSYDGASGSRPSGALVQSGTTLYGHTHLGGLNDTGVLFRIGTDGTDYQVLHDFGAGASSEPQRPIDTPLLSGGMLYGTTSDGGSSHLGAVFAIRTDGTGLQTLHSFSDSASDGRVPDGGLTVVGSTLYGITTSGGSSNLGTVYRVNTDGTGFQVTHSFSGGASDGAQLPLQPQLGALVAAGSNLYGTGYGGGAGDNGVVFALGTDGSGFQLLHRFAGADGAKPTRALLLSGTTLYGMTSQGGNQNLGVIFAVDVP